MKPGSPTNPKRTRKSRSDIHALSTGDLLGPIMNKMGLKERVMEETLLEEWTTLAGPQVSRHARPGRLAGGTLFVYVTHSIWLSELQRNGHQQLLKNLQDRFGTSPIKRLRIQLDPDFAPS